MRLIMTVCTGFLLCATPLLFAGVEKESWARGTSSAAGAFAKYGPRRIGILLVATGRKPEPGVEYAANALLADTGRGGAEPYRMSSRYELRLYEALRRVFQQHGYEVQCLNRMDWQGLRLRDVMAQAEGVDAVCAVHYSAERTYRVMDDGENTWWTPFEGMKVTLRCGVFDVATGDLIYRMEGETIGTEDLHTRVGKQVAEEPLYQGNQPAKSRFDKVLGVYVTEGSSPGFGRFSRYRIAIYHTAVQDPKTGERTIPLIRTPKGAFDISFVSNPENPASKSILDRLLQYVSYRPKDDEIEYFDVRTLERCGEILREKIPERRP